MTTTFNAATNGRGRKTLSGQIDRLDATLDGLSEAIPEVIADTIRSVAAQAVGDAVRAAVAEVLTDPAVLETLRAAAAVSAAPVAQAAPPQPAPECHTLWGRLAGAAKACWDWARGRANRAVKAVGAAVPACVREAVGLTRVGIDAVGTGAARARAWARSLAGTLGAVLTVAGAVVCQFRTPLLVASAAGLVVGVGCYLAGPVVASALCGLGGFAASLAATLLRGLWRELKVPNALKA